MQFLASIVLSLQLLTSIPAFSESRSAIFEAQIANLDNAAVTVRIDAIKTLAQLKDEEVIAAVPWISARLRDENPKVRIVAARTLGTLGDLAREAVADIGQALTDDQFAVTAIHDNAQFQSVAMSAATALADLGPIGLAALKDLLHAMRSNDAHLRAAAAKAIGYIGNEAKQASSELVLALSDPSPETRFEAALALGQLGPLSDNAVAALEKALTDTSTIIETRLSGAKIIGSVRNAAAEALLNLNHKHLAVIRQHGGAMRQSGEKHPELPWISGRRLHFTANVTDIRDLIAVVLMANQISVSFSRDIEGYMTFEFLGMPAQGAFNMLMHQYNLSYDWNERRRHVYIFPKNSLKFSTLPVIGATPINLTKSQKRHDLGTSRVRKKSGSDLPAHTVAATPSNKSEANLTKPTKSPPILMKNIIASEVRETRQLAFSKNPKQSEAPTDITNEHKLSFIIKYDGQYRATIDGKEYTAGMTIPTARGDMIIQGIRKRMVRLIHETTNGLKSFVIHQRRKNTKSTK